MWGMPPPSSTHLSVTEFRLPCEPDAWPHVISSRYTTFRPDSPHRLRRIGRNTSGRLFRYSRRHHVFDCFLAAGVLFKKSHSMRLVSREFWGI